MFNPNSPYNPMGGEMGGMPPMGGTGILGPLGNIPGKG